MSSKRYKRRMHYANGESSQEFTENAASLTDALDRELKWVMNTARKVVEVIEIEQE